MRPEVNMVRYVHYNNTDSVFSFDQFIKVYFSDLKTNSFTVYRTFEIKRSKLIKDALKSIHETPQYKKLVSNGYSRTLNSEIREWKANNIRYKLHMDQVRTQHTNFYSDISRIKSLKNFLLSCSYWLLG